MSKSALLPCILGAMGLLQQSAGRAQSIYWSQEGPDYIVVRADLDGQNIAGVIPGEIVLPTDFALDSQNQVAFITNNNSDNQSISRVDLQTGQRSDLIVLQLGSLYEIEVDPVSQKLFWVHSPTGFGSQLERVDFDGSNRAVLRTNVSVIAVDPLNERLYWVGEESGQYGIFRSDYEGQLVELVIDPDHGVTDVALDVQNGRIYWCYEGTWSQGGPTRPTTIQRANLDGSGVETILSRSPFDSRIIRLAFDMLGQRLFFYDFRTRAVERIAGDGTDLFLFRDDNVHISSLAFDAHENKLFWLSSLSRRPLHKANFDGSEEAHVINFSAARRGHLQIDPFGGRMYWVDGESFPYGDSIRRSFLDGSGEQILREGPIRQELSDFSFQLNQMSIDRTNGLIFFYEYLLKSAKTMRLDGTQESVIWTFPSETSPTPSEMDFDPIDGVLYWGLTPNDAPSSLLQTAVQDSSTETLVENLPEFGKGFFGFAVDPLRRTLNWLEMSFQTGHALYYQMDLLDRVPVLLSEVPSAPGHPGTWPRSLTLDHANGDAYWIIDELQQDADGDPVSGNRLLHYSSTTGTVSVVVSNLKDAVPAGVSHDPSFTIAGTTSRKVNLVLPILRNEVVALRLTSPDYPCMERFLDADGTLSDQPLFRSVTDWGHPTITDEDIIPGTTYVVSALHTDGAVSEPLVATTRKWCDIVAPFASPGGSIQPDFTDIQTVVNCFRAVPGSPIGDCDLYPAMLDGIIDFRDIGACVDAFRGVPYPLELPPPCP